jgi:hypothetical protein
MPNALAKGMLVLEAIICFGPLALILLLGTLVFPVWITTIVNYFSGTLEVWEPDGHLPWAAIWPTLVVISGYVGMIGLFLVLRALISGIDQAVGGLAALVMVFIGIAGLILFNIQVGGIDPRDDLVAALVYWMLPAIGSAHLLYIARNYLFRR